MSMLCSLVLYQWDLCLIQCWWGRYAARGSGLPTKCKMQLHIGTKPATQCRGIDTGHRARHPSVQHAVIGASMLPSLLIFSIDEANIAELKEEVSHNKKILEMQGLPRVDDRRVNNSMLST